MCSTIRTSMGNQGKYGMNILRIFCACQSFSSVVDKNTYELKSCWWCGSSECAPQTRKLSYRTLGTQSFTQLQPSASARPTAPTSTAIAHHSRNCHTASAIATSTITHLQRQTSQEYLSFPCSPCGCSSTSEPSTKALGPQGREGGYMQPTLGVAGQ